MNEREATKEALKKKHLEDTMKELFGEAKVKMSVNKKLHGKILKRNQMPLLSIHKSCP
jgi:hypothetical protein